jgi:Domain of unknown function (DUF4951)
MKWGSGEDAALGRVLSLTKDDLESIDVTLEMALEWADFYDNEVIRNPTNGSAKGRAVLMRRAAELLGGAE